MFFFARELGQLHSLFAAQASMPPKKSNLRLCFWQCFQTSKVAPKTMPKSETNEFFKKFGGRSNRERAKKCVLWFALFGSFDTLDNVAPSTLPFT